MRLKLNDKIENISTSGSEAISVIGIVCARAGSKRLPNKNQKIIKGKSLVQIAVETLSLGGISDIVLAADFEPDFDLSACNCSLIKRPANVSGDQVPLQETVKWAYHSLEKEYDYIIFLMPNCPGINPSVVRRMIEIAAGRKSNVIRSYSQKGNENGLIMVRTAYLKDHFIDVYCDCVVCEAEEIHDLQDYERAKQKLEQDHE